MKSIKRFLILLFALIAIAAPFVSAHQTKTQWLWNMPISGSQLKLWLDGDTWLWGSNSYINLSSSVTIDGTLNTGQGAYELYAMNQNVLTTSQPTFGNLTLTYGIAAATGVFSGALSGATLNTGQGAYELYAMNQNVQTTDRPTFSNLTLTYGVSAATGVFSGALSAAGITGTSFVIGANTLTTSEWGYLDGINQALKTTDFPTFGNLTLTYGVAAVTGTFSGALSAAGITGTSFVIGANTLDTNEWAYLDGQDQALKTTSRVTFSNLNLTYGVSAATGVFSGALSGAGITGTSFIIGGNTLDTNEWAYLDGQDQAMKTTSQPTLGNLNLTYGLSAATATFSGNISAAAVTGTSFVIGANTLNTSEWGYLDGINQALKTTDNPTFNSLILTSGMTAATMTITGTLSVPGTQAISSSGGLELTYGMLAATANVTGQLNAGSLITSGDITVTGADITLDTYKAISGDAAGSNIGAGFEVVINTNAVILGQTYSVGNISCDGRIDGTYFSATDAKVVYYDEFTGSQRNGHAITMISLTNGTSTQFHHDTMGKIMSFDIIAGTYSVRGSCAANGTPTLTIAGTCAEAGTTAGVAGKINIVDQGANSVVENNTGATIFAIIDQKWIDTP